MNFNEYQEEILKILLHCVEFPNMYLDTTQTSREIKQCFNKGLTINEAVNFIIWG